METMTRGSVVRAELTALFRARNTLLWVVTREEMRAERVLLDAAGDAGYGTIYWDCVKGVQDMEGATIGGEESQNPGTALNLMAKRDGRAVWVFRDLHKFMDPIVLRQVRSLARDLQRGTRDKARTIVVLSPSSEIPPELAGHTTVIDFPLPDRAEVAAILDDVLKSLPEETRAKVQAELVNGAREAAIDAAVGLSAEEAAGCYAKSLVKTRRIDPKEVAQEKKRVIARERVLEWFDPDPRGFEAIGGLDLLKDWLRARRKAFSAEARDFGLPAPKGVCLVGVPGCGKSLTAKCVAAAWGMPLLRMDLGALRSKYVGESEGNIRKALRVAETVSPCVLWLDEIEKALAGSTGEQGDGGVAADALGAILSWMQERAGQVFVVATANDVSKLPPELLRKGRFDEVFFVDLPNYNEAKAILEATIRKFGRDPSKLELARVAGGKPGGNALTGSEWAEVIPDALYRAFERGGELTTDDLFAARDSVVPLSSTAKEKIDSLRQWAKGRARLASAPVTETKVDTLALDL